MKYEIDYSTKFKKDYKIIKKRGYNISLLRKTIEILANGQELPPEYKDHALKGKFSGYRECHITSDWLFVYKIENNMLMLFLSRTGTHSDLF